ncbi:hypothetical protein AB0P12_32865 [Streptomyces subrutilus]|uniref:hypothetical protein n=1 Tax=Streptomyces subrutilus TaxID=36818 RepID=UPI00343D34C8
MARAAGGGLGAGAAHLRAEWGRWWRTEDLTDTHIAHHVLNDQFRTWQRFQQRHQAEVQQSIGLLKEQQKQARQSQIMQMNLQRQRQRQGRHGGYGYGGGGGASPAISNRMMQWTTQRMRIAQQEFRHLEVTPAMLHIGRGQVRSRRHYTAAGWLVGLGAAWAGLWALSPAAALAAVLVVLVVFAVAAAAAGRNPARRRPPVPKLLFIPPSAPAHTELAADPDPEPVPFALREAGRDPRQVREAVRLALRKEGVRDADVLVPDETAYGWRVPIVLGSGTPAQLVATLPKAATTLRVGESRIMAQPADPDDAARLDLTILTRDPFVNPPAYPERAPGSCTITDPFSLGPSMDGDPTRVYLPGQHILIVSDTGGGKTSAVQAIAEYVTACRDAVVVDIDPAKRGLKALAPTAAMTARTPEEAETVLAALLDRAQRRIASMPPTQDQWIATQDGPAVLVIVDEYPKLSKRGKALAVELLRLGREALITLLICTQDATGDVLGDAIADVFGIRIMLPCRAADVPLVVGRADAIGRGWLPHLLEASPEIGVPADAGRFYCLTPHHRTPVLRYVVPLPPAEADRRARERVAAGLPRLESDTPAPTVVAPPTVALLLAAFATHGDPEELSVAQIAEHLCGADPATWRQWDARKDRLAMIGRTLQARLKREDVTIGTHRLDALSGRPTGYRLADIRGALS